MLSIGNYVNLFVGIAKINILKLQMVTSYTGYFFLYAKTKPMKEIGEWCKDTQKWEKYHDTKKILKRVFQQPGNPRFSMFACGVCQPWWRWHFLESTVHITSNFL